MPDFADRLVDVTARRPHGLLGRLLYRFPFGHKRGFDLVLAHLGPEPSDCIVEVGCGGGVFLRRALRSGCQGIALDHSNEMVEATLKLNAAAVREGRLTVSKADASNLPVETGTADKVFCLNAFFFFPDPGAAIGEMARILKPGGKLAIITAPPEWRDTIARFFGRMADAMRFDKQDTLTDWAERAGLQPEETLAVPNAGILFIAGKNERGQ